MDLIEQPLLEKTAETLAKQDLRRYPKGLPKGKFKDRPNSMTKEAWLEYLTNQRENVKARAKLLDKLPIISKDLDDANIRPGLKETFERKSTKFLKQLKQAKKSISNVPGVKPTLEVLDTARKHPVATTLTTIPVLSAFDVADAAESGAALLKDDYSDENKEINQLQKMSDQYKFTSATTGVASLNPLATTVAAPTSFTTGAIHLILENRINRIKARNKKIDKFLNPRNFGQTEIKQWDPEKERIERIKNLELNIM